MLRLITITPVIKQRIKEMIEVLIPEVGYVRVTNSGLVHLKKRWWSFRKETTNTTDLLISALPRRISEFSIASKRGENVWSTISKGIENLIYMNGHSYGIDLCEFVWDQYNKHCVIVPNITMRTNAERNLLQQTNYVPAIRAYDTTMVKELIRIISKNRKRSISEILQDSLIKLKNSIADVKETSININIRRFFTTMPIHTT